MMNRLWPLVAGLAVAALPAFSQTQIERVVRLQPGQQAEVTVLCPAGDVTVQPVQGREVRVVARVPDPRLRLETTALQGGKSALVRLVGDPDPGAVLANLEVFAPVWASVWVQGLTGSKTVRVADPDVSVTVISRDGDVRVSGKASSLSLSSVSGSTAAEGDFGDILARTATGSITIRGSAATTATYTMGGQTMTTVTGLMRGSFDSVSGDLVLRVGFGPDAALRELRAQTSQGDIELIVLAGLPASAFSDATSRIRYDPVLFPKGTFTAADARRGPAGVVHDLPPGHLELSLGPETAPTRITLYTTNGTIKLDTWRPE